MNTARIILLLVFLLGSGAVPLHAAEAPARKPNIISILSDDLAQGDLGCYATACIGIWGDGDVRYHRQSLERRASITLPHGNLEIDEQGIYQPPLRIVPFRAGRAEPHLAAAGTCSGVNSGAGCFN